MTRSAGALAGARALVSGSAGGIGSAVGLALANAGASVHGLDCSYDEATRPDGRSWPSAAT